jgi:hypothetical protein
MAGKKLGINLGETASCVDPAMRHVTWRYQAASGYHSVPRENLFVIPYLLFGAAAVVF